MNTWGVKMTPSGFMIDMDGTVYRGNEPISGAKEAIDFLNEKKIPFVFLTNNSSHTRAFYHKRLTSMGFDVTEDKILTSTIATVRFIKERRKEKKVFVIASPDVTEEIESLGIKSTENEPDIVLLTFDRTITFDKINKAYHFILNGAELIATHPDELCPTETSYDVDIGPFIHMLSMLTGTSPIIIGKPSRLMLEMAAGEMNISMEDTAMIGDRLYTDIKMANDAEIMSIMVLTGEAKESDPEEFMIFPRVIVSSFAHIPDLITDGFFEKMHHDH